MERRDFMKALAAGSVCAALPVALAGCAGFRYLAYTREGNRLVVSRTAFGEGPYALLENPQLPRAIYLHRFEDGTFGAVLTRCMHKGCQVEPAGDRLACPCHGSEYSFRGEVLNGPTEHPLLRYQVTADAQNIYIELLDPSVL
jgi:cytochrome b6-f complex iron-sulfur subunit